MKGSMGSSSSIIIYIDLDVCNSCGSGSMQFQVQCNSCGPGSMQLLWFTFNAIPVVQVKANDSIVYTWSKANNTVGKVLAKAAKGGWPPCYSGKGIH